MSSKSNAPATSRRSFKDSAAALIPRKEALRRSENERLDATAALNREARLLTELIEAYAAQIQALAAEFRKRYL